MSKVPQIVLTGGPCGGKTTALAKLTDELTNHGFRVLCVPEIATMLITSGLSDVGVLASDPNKLRAIEEEFLLMQMALVQRYQSLANHFVEWKEKPILLLDRGPADCKAYTRPGEFEALLEDQRLTLYDVRDQFTGVVHLVTAANGAESFYNLNNIARRETPAQARELDQRTLEAWYGHKAVRILDNSTDFEGKMKRLMQAVLRMLGIPAPLEIERKFLVRGMPDFNHPVLARAVASNIEQIYLEKDGSGDSLRIRKRSQDGHSLHFFTRKKTISSIKRLEMEEIISAWRYLELKPQQQKGTQTILKIRHCFAWENQYFELDVFVEPKTVTPLVLLEVELTEETDKIVLPPFIKIDREVTDDPNFTNSAIARGSLAKR